MKYVSCACKSKGMTATITPVSPPSTKTKKKPRMNSMGDFNGRRRTAAAMVAIQANTWMAVGTDTAMLAADAKLSDNAGIPVANM
ncbi:hypothetical protein D3C72_1183170 [compost metagenome]